MPRCKAATATRHTMAISVRSILTLVLSACLLSGCFLKPHKIDIQQGNFLDQAAISKLKPGMTRSQVRFLMGTPMISDPFHPERWDYMYLDSKGGKLLEEKRVTLYFDGDKLVRATTDLSGQSSLDGDKSAASTR
jgi:outer membrane protein assembly factor BamE